MTGGTLDIKADEKGVKGKLFIPIWVPSPKVKAELTGGISTDYTGKKPIWDAGITIRF